MSPRVSIPLSRPDARIDVTLDEDATPETIDAFRQLGEAVLRKMDEDRLPLPLRPCPPRFGQR